MPQRSVSRTMGRPGNAASWNRGTDFGEIPLPSSHRGAPSQEMPDQRNHRNNQQRMDQTAGNVKHDPAEDPANQEYEKEREEHETSCGPSRMGRSSQTLRPRAQKS